MTLLCDAVFGCVYTAKIMTRCTSTLYTQVLQQRKSTNNHVKYPTVVSEPRPSAASLLIPKNSHTGGHANKLKLIEPYRIVNAYKYFFTCPTRNIIIFYVAH